MVAVMGVDYFVLVNHLAALGRRCGQPGQQHGRFFPALRSACSRLRCAARVSAFLTIVTQQIHSFRARGVSAFQASRTRALPSRAARISFGTR